MDLQPDKANCFGLLDHCEVVDYAADTVDYATPTGFNFG